MQSLNIIYEDHHVVAVHKPAKCLVAGGGEDDPSLLDQVRDWNAGRQVEGKKGYCVPIHFLDRPVSGVVLFAVSSKAASRLNELFRERHMTKVYVAVTETVPKEQVATLEHWLVKTHDENITAVGRLGDEGAKKCVLSYRVLSQSQGQSNSRALIMVKPITGRSHQIRVQLAAIGAPIVGDVKYGAKSGWGGRIGLHALTLSFDHPVGKAPLELTAPIPGYWNEIWSNAIPKISV